MEEMVDGPSTSQMCGGDASKFSKVHFDEKLCYAPVKEDARERIQ